MNTADQNTHTTPHISIVVPVYNEEENLRPLMEELASVLDGMQTTWEAVFVDDGSTDTSCRVLVELRQQYKNIQIVRFKANCGQTAAFAAGFQAARGEVIVTMDADLQNDPHDIPRLIEHINEYDLVCGWRHKRNDTLVRRISSRIANAVRNRLSGETIQDVACSLKAFRRVPARRLKLFTGMHRFFPTLIKMDGGRVLEVKVNHRARKFGTAKYGIGNRALRAFIDLLAVCWMKNRHINYEISEHIL